MRIYIFPVLLLAFTSPIFSQNYSRVSIDLRSGSPEVLANLGIETDHGTLIPGKILTTDLSKTEIANLKAAGFEYKIIIPDVQEWYREQNNIVQERGAGPCTGSALPAVHHYPTPANYTTGSMGGYLTYDEMLAELDEMWQKYPDLISEKQIVSDTITTHDGRVMWWVRISDNAVQEENEPKALYTALHHSREPVGMTQNIFFMWYLLENYATHPEVKYLVDHAELYFIPCVNPDGYIYNETTNPNGGGLWRKNRRTNIDGTFGVDLNRNYGFQWGVDNQGSSGNPNSEVFRGTAPFSEPETRMLRDFCRQFPFTNVLNYHTFGNLLVYPWAYSEEIADERFPYLAEAINQDSKFRSGTPTQTVGYPVNGDSNDWMYAEGGSIAYTPESGPGSFGFWPPADTIDGLNKVTQWGNLVLGWSMFQLALATDLSNTEIYANMVNIPIEIKRYGLLDGSTEVSIQAISPAVTNITPANQSLNLAVMGSETVHFDLIIDPATPFGSTIELEVITTNGDLVLRDTLRKLYYPGTPTVVFEDNFADANQWTAGSWGITDEHFTSPPNSFTDSPYGDYENNALVQTEMDTFVSIPATALLPKLQFDARWSIEDGYDWVTVEAVDPGGNTTPLCGKYSHTGGSNQPPNFPLWDGNQTEWVQEYIDLSDFKGQTIKIRFTLYSDQGLRLDGFYYDNLEISYLDTITSGIKTVGLEISPAVTVVPNPAHDITTIYWNPATVSTGFEFTLFNELGQSVLSQTIKDGASGRSDISLKGIQAGIYQWNVVWKDGRQTAGKLVVIE